MISQQLASQQLAYTLSGVSAPNLGEKIEGKVRDCFVIGDVVGDQRMGNRRVLVASDRLSAFDRVLTTIPFKGQMLTQLAHFWFEQTKHIVKNHIIEYPHPNVLIAHEIEMLPVEVVIRGYLTGSAWRDYVAGKDISGVVLPKGMRRSQVFDSPIITPSTKGERGVHDEPISSEEIVRSGLVEKVLWEQVCEIAHALFAFGSSHANKQGLILVDTKYEFGVLTSPSGKKEIILADEIHTQDSSRYWMSDSYNERFKRDEDPDMLDKEFVRRWLIEQGYMGDGEPPKFTDEFRVATAIKYAEAYEKITGTEFSPTVGPIREGIEEVLRGL